VGTVRVYAFVSTRISPKEEKPHPTDTKQLVPVSFVHRIATLGTVHRPSDSAHPVEKGRKIFQPVLVFSLIRTDAIPTSQPTREKPGTERAWAKRNCSNPLRLHTLSPTDLPAVSLLTLRFDGTASTTHRATWNRFDVGRVVSQKETLGCDPPLALAATSRRSGCVIDPTQPPYLSPNCTFLILNLAFLQPQHRILLFSPHLLPPLRQHVPVDVLTRRRTGHSTAISSLP
jgi:hypothetical protein